MSRKVRASEHQARLWRVLTHKFTPVQREVIGLNSDDPPELWIDRIGECLGAQLMRAQRGLDAMHAEAQAAAAAADAMREAIAQNASCSRCGGTGELREGPTDLRIPATCRYCGGRACAEWAIPFLTVPAPPEPEPLEQDNGRG